MIILINNEIIEDTDITGKELIVYCALHNLFYSKERDSVFFHYGSLHYELTEREKMGKEDRVNYVAILKKLSDYGYIIIKPLNDGKYTLDIRYLDIQDGEFFTRVEATNILKLYKLYKTKAYSLCKQYLYILKVLGERPYFGISINEIAQFTGISPQTVSQNNILLKESGLLYILFTTHQGCLNTYGKPEFKDEIDAYGKKRGIVENSSIRRSITARYKNLNTGKMDLPDAERLLADMEREIAEHPEAASDKWDMNKVKDYIAKLKPESINAVDDDEFIKGLFSD